MKLIPINILSAVIFPFVFSACVSQSSVDFNKQQAAKARVELALGYLQQEDFVQAKLNLDKAFEHDDHYYLVHSALAHFYQLQGDTEKAKQAYLQAIKLDDKQGDVYNNFGAFLCGQGEFEQAYSQLNAAGTRCAELLPSSRYLRKHGALCFRRKTNRCLSTGIG